MRRYTPHELVNLLQSCHGRHGAVNAKIITADPLMPDPQLLVRTFGSLMDAYDAAGLPASPKYAFVATKKRLVLERLKLSEEVKTLAHTAGGTADKTSEPDMILINGTLRVQIMIAVPRNPRRGQRNWRICGRPNMDFSIVGRFEPKTGCIADYYLFSASDLVPGPIYLKESNLGRFARMRHLSANSMFGLAAHGDSGFLC